MATCRIFLNSAKRNKSYHFKYQKLFSTSAEVKPTSDKRDEIVIPYRIHRGPTDILKALASTISKDFTAPQYKYEDDPFFIPASNVTKRAFALSKESGKKAARYFLEKYPDLFVNKAEPRIKAYSPPVVYTEENVSSVDVLVECIKDFEVQNSISVYQILKKKDIPVSQETKQDLLELLCFYNGNQPADEDYYEERYFQRKDLLGEKWNLKGVAERLFDEMEKDSRAYSAMIAGAGKFLNAERANNLYEEMVSKNLKPTVEAYNSLISVTPLMKERNDLGSEYALFLLGNMQRDGLLPNLYTMNALLDVLLKRRFRRTKELSLGILGEMKQLNIEPSLGTYSLLLSIFCDDMHSEVGALYEIINKIEGKEFIPRHPLDVTFFSSAMAKCFRYTHDKDLAYRINKIAEFGNNCKLLGNAFSESQYFKNFLRLLCETEELDKFMEVYEQYVPNTYIPEPSLMLDVINHVHFAGGYKYLPKLCSDVYVFEQTERENILSVLLEATGSIKHEIQTQTELVDIVWKIVQKINTRLASKRFDFNWQGSVLGNALNTFINGDDLEKSWSIIENLGNEKLVSIGIPEKETFLKFCDLCLQKQEYEKVKFCIKYVRKEAYPEFGDDFQKLTENMFKKETLLPKQRLYVDAILRSISQSKASKESSGDSSSSSSSDSSSDSSSSSDEEDNK